MSTEVICLSLALDFLYGRDVVQQPSQLRRLEAEGQSSLFDTLGRVGNRQGIQTVRSGHGEIVIHRTCEFNGNELQSR